MPEQSELEIQELRIKYRVNIYDTPGLIEAIEGYKALAKSQGKSDENIREAIGEIKDENGNTLLHLVTAPPNMRPRETPPTPETRAEIAGILIDNGVDVNAENNQGKKAIDSCLGLNGSELHPEIIRKLLDKGADVTSQMLLDVEVPYGRRSWAVPANHPSWPKRREVHDLISSALKEQQRAAFLNEIKGVVNEPDLEKIMHDFVPEGKVLSDHDFTDYLTDSIPLEKKREVFLNEIKNIFDDANLTKIMHDFVPDSKIASRKKPPQSKAQERAELKRVMFDGAAAAAGAGKHDQSHNTHASTAHKPPPPRSGRGRG